MQRFSGRSTPLRPALFLVVLLAALHAGAAPAQQAGAALAAANHATAAVGVEPWSSDRFYLQTSLVNIHFHYDPGHVKYPKLLYGEYRLSDRWLLGAAAFDNSFGQSTQALFGGWRYRPFPEQPFYIKVLGGLVHGYRGQYRDKIPLNHSGVAPAIIPAFGFCYARFCTELIVIGGAGVVTTIGVTIP
ncbi:MAG TPA: sn-glycerol-3-phosphate transporter [Casimicrobiaceae bacterium]|nr:sn-glycerol-3-phosphate transporter [Casimicrobiaceae bacterium]